MDKEFEKIGKLKITTLADVSSHGSGLYVRIAKAIWETYKINGGDRLEVTIGDHFRPIGEEDAED